MTADFDLTTVIKTRDEELQIAVWKGIYSRYVSKIGMSGWILKDCSNCAHFPAFSTIYYDICGTCNTDYSNWKLRIT